MNRRTLLALALPGAAPLCGAAALLVSARPATVAQVVGTYPYVAAAAALFLAGRFQRSRLFALSLVVLTTAVTLGSVPEAWGPLAHALLATLLPIICTLLAPMRDAGMGTQRAFVQSFIVACALLTALLARVGWSAEIGTLLTYDVIDPIYTDWSGLHQPALLLWIPCLVTLVAVMLKRQHAADAGLLFGTLFLLLAIAWPQEAHRSLWLLAASAALIIALVEASRATALHDELTGLPARRALNQVLDALRPPYTIAIVDIDHFKTFNDRYGHDVGDQVLRMVAGRLDRVRDGTAYRSGGEEFTIVFPGLDKMDAALRMEEVRAAVENEKFTLRGADRRRSRKGAEKRGRGRSRDQKLGVTISVGLASPSPRADTIPGVVKAADQAMYRAKKDGRNRVVA